MAWTDELKQQAIAAYKAANPTAETSIELIKDIAEELDQSVNGVRMILIQAGVYVKKEASAGTTKAASGEGTKRVSKEDAINALKTAIENAGGDLDEEILDKLTGKAATYLAEVINKIAKA